jgi:hypothetical protein
MKDVYFGAESRGICVCGVELVGTDYDDEYFLHHGSIEALRCSAQDEVVPGSTICGGSPADAARREADGVAWMAARPTCPECGAARERRAAPNPYMPDRAGTGWLWVCPTATDVRRAGDESGTLWRRRPHRVVRLRGCASPRAAR